MATPPRMISRLLHGLAVKANGLGAVALDNRAVQRHARECAARSRPGKNLGMHQRIGVRVRVPADRAGGDIDIHPQRELVGSSRSSPLLIHDEQNNIRGIRARAACRNCRQ